VKRSVFAAALLCLSLTVSAAPVVAQSKTMSVAEIQTALAGLQYYNGPVNGVMGARTRIALSDFARDHGKPFTGGPSPDLLSLLDVAYIMSQSDEGCSGEDC